MKTLLITIIVLLSTGFGFGQITQTHSKKDSIFPTTRYNSVVDSTGIIEYDISKYEYGASGQNSEGEGTNDPILNGYEEIFINDRRVYIKQNDTIRSVYKPGNQ